jgi:putative DNA primase/helicase
MSSSKSSLLTDSATFIRENKKDAITMAIQMLSEYPALLKCQENFYEYNGKCYDMIARERLQEMLYDFCVKYGITSIWNKRNDIIQALMSSSRVPRIEKLNNYPNLINLNNGILDLYTRELIPHSSEYYFDSTIQVDYNSTDCECPVFTKYLNDVLSGDQETIDNVIRLGGYLLDTSCEAGRMFMFDGNGGSGKSTLIDTYSMFFDDKQLTAISLEELATGSFDKEDLIDSRFNQAAETKKGFISPEEIKKMITGDLIKVSRKFKRAHTFRPKFKIVVACNGLPKFNDTSDGIYRRIVIVRFKNQYKSASDIARIKNATERRIFVKDPTLKFKIQAEKSAILNLFLDGLITLKENGYEFIDSTDSHDAMTDFRRDSDTAREFLEENYEVDFDGATPLQAIYDNYRRWYRDNVQDTQGMKFRSNEMGRRIKEVFGLDSGGQKKMFNANYGKYEQLTVYQLKQKEVLPDEGALDHLPIMLPEETGLTQAQLGY